MTDLYEHEDIPIPLTRRTSSRPPSTVAEVDRVESEREPLPRLRGRAAEVYDRMSPAVAGGIAGFFAGAAGLGVVQLIERTRMDHAFIQAATSHAMSADAAIAIGYVTAGAAGALVGACFAMVTRHLRRFFPLLIWALVFFVSLTMLVLAVSRSYGNAAAATMAPAILAATAAYAFVAAFQLPLRKRERAPEAD